MTLGWFMWPHPRRCPVSVGAHEDWSSEAEQEEGNPVTAGSLRTQRRAMPGRAQGWGQQCQQCPWAGGTLPKPQILTGICCFPWMSRWRAGAGPVVSQLCPAPRVLSGWQCHRTPIYFQTFQVVPKMFCATDWHRTESPSFPPGNLLNNHWKPLINKYILTN